MSMWNVRAEKCEVESGRRFVVQRETAPVTFAEAITLLADDKTFRTFLIETLADAPYPAFRWETPGVTRSSSTKPFEFVVLDSPELSRRADRKAFAEHFDDTSAEAVAFANLGGNAVLVVPTPQGEPQAYGHLAPFVRSAPTLQQHALWRLVGEELKKRLNDRPVWLSTAGAGVAWLHVRLDDRPKYYGYRPYTVET